MASIPRVVTSLLWLVALAAAIWAAFLVVLILSGRKSEAKVVARLIPDLLVLFKRLLSDDRVPRRRRALLWLTLGYLALPIDIVPDFIPVAGQLDDAIVVAVVMRSVLRGVDPVILEQLWPGPPAGLALLKRVARLRATSQI